MLIYLPKREYRDESAPLPSDPRFGLFVERLATCIADGHHWVKAAPTLLNEMAELDGLSQRQTQALREASRANVTPEVDVGEVTDVWVITGPQGKKDEAPAGQVWHRLDWSALANEGHAIPPVTLAGENAHDADWFVWWAKAFAVQRAPQRRNRADGVKLLTRGLGGSTAENEAPHTVKSGYPLLCVVDSDRDHPEAKPGGTAQKLLQALARLPSPTWPNHVEVLDARAVENLAPDSLVEKLQSTRELAAMRKRGAFIGPHRPPDDARWLNLGRAQCARHPPTSPKAQPVVAAAFQLMAAADPDAPLKPPCQDTCLLEGKEKTPREECRMVHNIGKLPKRLSAVLDEVSDPDEAGAQLAKAWPPPGSTPWQHARRIWSWSVSRGPRIRSA